jgi:hypothetical protein
MDHNSLENSNYGIMASALAVASKINMNNFIGYGNTASAGAAWGPAGAGGITPGVDMSNNYWDQGAPTGTGATVTPAAAAKISPVGPR